MFGMGMGMGSVKSRGGVTTGEIVAQLFAAAEPGWMVNLADFSTLFQDSAGTVPVTAAGQPVGKMLDISGRGVHFTQSTDANRPILQIDGAGHYYLACDGALSGMVSASINLTANSSVFVCAAVRKLSDAALGAVIEHGVSPANINCFGLAAPASAGATLAITGRSTAGTSGTAGVSVSGHASPKSVVLSATIDYAAATGAEFSLRINGVASAQNVGVTQANTGTLGTQIFYLFRRAGASSPFNGRFYGGLVRAGAITAAQIAMTENYMNDLLGT